MDLEKLVQGYEASNTDLKVEFGKIEDAFEVRYNVFTLEQDIDEELDKDGNDQDSVQFIYYNNSGPVGTVRLRKSGDGTGKVERLAVLDRCRGCGIGGKLMEELENFSEYADLRVLKMSAQKQVEDFYHKLGYFSVGKEYEEVGIPHIEMKKKIKK